MFAHYRGYRKKTTDNYCWLYGMDAYTGALPHPWDSPDAQLKCYRDVEFKYLVPLTKKGLYVSRTASLRFHSNSNVTNPLQIISETRLLGILRT